MSRIPEGEPYTHPFTKVIEIVSTAVDPLSLTEPFVQEATVFVAERTVFRLPEVPGDAKGLTGKEQIERLRDVLVGTRGRAVMAEQKVTQVQEETERVRLATQLQTEIAVAQQTLTDKLQKEKPEKPSFSEDRTRGIPEGYTPKGIPSFDAIQVLLAVGRTAGEAFIAIGTDMAKKAALIAEAGDPEKLLDARNEAIAQVGNGVNRAFGIARTLFINIPGFGVALKVALDATGAGVAIAGSIESLQLMSPPAIATLIGVGKAVIIAAGGTLAVANLPWFALATIGSTALGVGIVAMRNRKFAKEIREEMKILQAQATQTVEGLVEKFNELDGLKEQALQVYETAILSIDKWTRMSGISAELVDVIDLDPNDPETIKKLEKRVANIRQQILALGT